MEYLRIILNNALYLSFLVIIISSVVGVFIAGRKRDLCLKDFHGFECRLNLDNGKTIYGVLRAFGSGIEIEYTQEHHDTQGHTESSFILYSAESAQIDSIKRFHHDLSPENQSERSREIRSTYHPNLIRIIRRKFRNFLNTFQDGLKKSLTMFIGAAASRNPKSQISTQKKELGGLGTQMIGAVSYSFDSILERYIGHYVVLEMPVDGQNTEFCGILKDYTQGYIEVLNVVELKKIMVTSGSDNSEDNKWLHVSINESGIDVSNISEWPIYIESISLNNKTENLNKILPVEGKHHLENLEFPESDSQIVSQLIIPESLDLVIPRRTSFIRHGCPRYNHTIETLLGRSSSHTVQEAMQTQFTRLINARKFSDQNES